VYAPRYKSGQLVRCVYDFMDFYRYVYDDLDESDYTHYGIIIKRDDGFVDYLDEYVYEVLCVDGLKRHFIESEIVEAL
jgi:hypothetical protein